MKVVSGVDICDYCYKPLVAGNVQDKTITRRNNGKLERLNGAYCKDTKCAARDQMAHEG